MMGTPTSEQQGLKVIAKAFTKVANENISMKKEIEKLKNEKLANAVAHKINEWLDESYNGSPLDDIKQFSEKITAFIVNELRK